MWELFLAGGPVMWPLLLCSLVSLAVILERAYYWSRLDIIRDRNAVDRLLEIYRATGKAETGAESATGTTKGVVFRMLLSGIAHEGFSSAKAMEALALDEVRTMRRGMNILDTIITIAPMLGILGTVMGIITSFDMLGQSGVEDPKAVVSGIAEALITTAAGLMISVATVFPFNYFNARTEDAQDIFEHYGTRLEIVREDLQIGKRKS
jgi:Biopolymer transport proteins